MVNQRSVLDGVLTDNTAFPLGKARGPQKTLAVVGSCPTCGAPVYGSPTVNAGESPAVQWSCPCREAKKEEQVGG